MDLTQFNPNSDGNITATIERSPDGSVKGTFTGSKDDMTDVAFAFGRGLGYGGQMAQNQIAGQQPKAIAQGQLDKADSCCCECSGRIQRASNRYHRACSFPPDNSACPDFSQIVWYTITTYAPTVMTARVSSIMAGNATAITRSDEFAAREA
jgi:hypothetical protein